MIREIKERMADSYLTTIPITNGYNVFIALEQAESLIRLDVLDETPRKDIKERQRKAVEMIFAALKNSIMEYENGPGSLTAKEKRKGQQ